MFILPEKKFEFVDFEPVIDAKTMEIHYTKHHQAYVDNLNKLTSELVDKLTGGEAENLEYLLKNTVELPAATRQGIINNAGGHWNHSFWWEQLTRPAELNVPGKDVLGILNSSFGSFDIFKEEFTKVAMSRFGSGWVWVIKNKNENLTIESTGNQDSPLMSGKEPILGLDVWEHAYYLNYQNRRVEYVNAFWKILNWKVVEDRLNKS